MENKKGQIGVGPLVVVAVVIIVGVIFMQVIAQQVGSSTNTITLANSSFTSAAEGSSAYLDSYRAISSVVIYNATGTLVPAANYTVTNNVINPTTGSLSVQVATGAVNAYANDTWNISGTAQPVTYIADGGARSVAGLIVIMFALAVAVVALSPTLQSKMLEMFGR